MKRSFLVAILALAVLPVAASAVSRPASQGEAIGRTLVELGKAISSGRLESLHALTAASLPGDQLAILESEFQSGQPPVATLRERARNTDHGSEVLADVFVRRGRTAKVATWRLTLVPGPDPGQALLVSGVVEQAAFDGLVKLAIDPSRELVVHDLTFTGIDFTLKMPSGLAFVAEAGGGITTLVLRGRSEITFAPEDAAEQAQIRVLTRHPSLVATSDSAFIRLNPSELSEHLSTSALTASPSVDPIELGHARELFDRFGPQSFSIDLQDIEEPGWSLLPGPNNVVVEFKAGRLGWLTYARSPKEPEDISLISRETSRLFSTYASKERLAERGPIFDEDAGRPYDIEHYGLTLTFDPDKGSLSGHALMKIKTLADRVNVVNLRLDDGLAVSSVSMPGIGRLLAIRAVGQSRVLISLPGAAARGTEFVLDIAYGGRLQPPPLDREAMTLDPPDAGRQAIQTPAVEVFQPDPEPLFIYSGHVAWYPQAFVSDYATASMRLTVPAEYGIAASGGEVRSSLSTADDGARGAPPRSLRTVEFTADRPIRYLGCVIGRLQPAANGQANVPRLAPIGGDPNGPRDAAVINLNVVSTPRQLNQNRQLAGKIGDIVQFYAKTMGEAPYPALTVAAADDNVPGGHSPAYLSIIRQPLPTTPFDWRSDPVAFTEMPNFLLAHEIAHQWWGQAVGWRNYHEQWLSEGLAQYFALLFERSTLTAEMSEKILIKMRASVLLAAPKGPISLGYRLGHIENDGRTFRATVYNKGALVLQMLRDLIGDEAFFNGLRRFYREHRFDKAGTENLQAAFEAEAHQPLQRFFDRWIRSVELPRARVTSRLDAGGKSATLHVEQLGELFDYPLTFAVDYADGHTETVILAVRDQVADRRLTFATKVKKVALKDLGTLVSVVGG